MGVRNDYSLFRPFAIKFHYISGTPPAFIQHANRKQHMSEGMDSTTVGKHDHSVDCDYMYLLAKISVDIAANESSNISYLLISSSPDFFCFLLGK